MAEDLLCVKPWRMIQEWSQFSNSLSQSFEKEISKLSLVGGQWGDEGSWQLSVGEMGLEDAAD